MDDYGVLLWMGALILVSSVGGWWATRSLKRKLEKGLGRKVDESDITSISAWMQADDNALASAVNDDSAEHKVQEAMEDAFGDYVTHGRE
jgi:hypothetical protein